MPSFAAAVRCAGRRCGVPLQPLSRRELSCRLVASRAAGAEKCFRPREGVGAAPYGIAPSACEAILFKYLSRT